MTDGVDHSDRRTAIEAAIDDAVESAPGDALEPARATVGLLDDVWFGQLVGRTFDAVAADGDTIDSIARPHGPAAAVELLRRYCSIRWALLRGERSVCTVAEPGGSAAILSGDLLFAAAYATVGSDGSPVGDRRRSRLVVVLTRATTDIVETVGRNAGRLAAADPDDEVHETLVASVAGTLGECATRLGVLSAPVENPPIDTIETIGREASASRQYRRGRADAGPAPIPIRPSADSKTELSASSDGRAAHHRTTALRAIESLPAHVDQDPLRSLVD
ncbi:hypothetical protein [Halovivax cerinus]|uniref:Uncharacterized protein n=1 Tax=Halovivax cerinus TaxID=1487865 RepID=A0ABD5NIM2_9EURY|nr:hypothetical protein [Halovivax cerinus]